jgi:hypothetical protein
VRTTNRDFFFVNLETGKLVQSLSGLNLEDCLTDGKKIITFQIEIDYEKFPEALFLDKKPSNFFTFKTIIRVLDFSSPEILLATHTFAERIRGYTLKENILALKTYSPSENLLLIDLENNHVREYLNPDFISRATWQQPDDQLSWDEKNNLFVLRGDNVLEKWQFLKNKVLKSVLT